MFELLAHPDLKLFAILGGMVFALLLLEIALMLIGISTQVGEPDVDFDIDPGDIALPSEAIEAIDALDAADLADIEPLDSAVDIAPEGPGLLSALGLSKIPSALWLAGLFTFTAIFGFALQGMVNIFGTGYLPSLVALAVVAGPAVWVNARYAHLLGRLIPSVETTAISKYAFHKRQGVVVFGSARPGQRVEVSWTDGYNHTHYLLAEPLDPTDSLPAGTPVLILRTRDKQAKLLSLV